MSRTQLGARLLAIVPGVVVLGAGCHQGGPPHDRPAPVARDSVQVGYGTQATRDVTGAISTIDGDSEKHGKIRTMADLLEGRVPGLEVRRLSDGGVSVRIRGEHSLLRSGEPLYVIDGIPMQADGQSLLRDLDPRDVRSIQVLKDAGSLAAYGSRGANGVILISMRRPGNR